MLQKIHSKKRWNTSHLKCSFRYCRSLSVLLFALRVLYYDTKGDLLSLLTSPLTHVKDLLECLQVSSLILNEADQGLTVVCHKVIEKSADEGSHDQKNVKAVIKAIQGIPIFIV